MKKKALQICSPVATPDTGEDMQGFLILRSKTYYFRRKIPVEARPYFPGLSQIWRSLGTTDKRSANSLAMEWAVKTKKVFDFVKSAFPDDMKFKFIEMELSISNTPSVTENPKPKTGKKVEDIFNAFINHKKGNGEWSPKSEADNRFALELFVQVMGNLSVTQLNFQVIENYRDKLKEIPAMHSRLKKYKHLSVQELIAMPEAEKDMPDASTVNRRMGYVSSAFDFAVQRDMLVKNPASGIKVKEFGVILPHTQKPAYTVEDVQDIVHRLRLDMSNPAHFFVPLMAIFTGGRRSELCQFYVSDVKTYDGIPCLDFNGICDKVWHTPSSGKNKGKAELVPEKRLKRPASWRIVPIHPTLWYELGFGGYVQHCRKTGQKKLFPELGVHRDGAGTAFSKVYDEEIAPHVAGNGEVPKTFHSFRHTLQTWFKHHQLEGIEREFANEVVKELVGHSYNKSGKEDLSKERYGKKYPPQICASVLFQLDYETNFDCIREQVGWLNKIIGVAEKLQQLNPNLDYPQEDTREQ